jgi:uncharacterized protein with PIN domain
LTQALKFYLDTHIAKQVAVQLRQQDIDVIRCEEVGLGEADDETHLEYAAKHQYILITKDKGFRQRHFTWIAEGKNHHGVFLFKEGQTATIGSIVRFCQEQHALVLGGAGTPDDFKNTFTDTGV